MFEIFARTEFKRELMGMKKEEETQPKLREETQPKLRYLVKMVNTNDLLQLSN